MNFNPKFLFGTLLLLAAALMIIWKSASNNSSEESASTDNAPSMAVEKPSRPKRQPATSSTNRLPDFEGQPADPEARQAALEATLEKIDDAATTYDPAELPVIRPYLVSPDPELREAAVDAMIVLGDAAAGPMLREAAAKMESAAEAKAMLEAADFVELPPANLKELSKRSKDRPDGPPRGKRNKK